LPVAPLCQKILTDPNRMPYKANTFTAFILTVWLVLVMLSDNVLKPILLGRGAPVPMPVIFLGAIGGFMSMGFLGLFVGALILSVGFKLFETWLTAGEEEIEAKFE